MKRKTVRKKKAALAMIVCMAMLLVSCGHTAKRPLVTKDAAIPEEFTSITAGNDYLPEQRSWDDWAQKADDSNAIVVVKVKKLSSESYYWDEGENGVGGITGTSVLLEEVLLGHIDDFTGLTVGEAFRIAEHFTVDGDGKLLIPEYTLSGNFYSEEGKTKYGVNPDERTNPVMQVGGEYILCMWSGWLIGEKGAEYTLECKLDGGTVSVVPRELFANCYLCYEAFEYGDEAYADSCAVVSDYTESGESREANSYNFYHAMVKEAFERFSEK